MPAFDLRRLWTPNERAEGADWWVILATWLGLCVAIWAAFRPAVLPSPFDVLDAFPRMWTEEGLGQELLTSLWASLEALALSTAVALPLAYLSRTPAIRPLALGLAQLRFLSPAVFFLVLVLLTRSVKVYMLAMGEACFLATSMIGVVETIPAERFDDARTLRMGEWTVTWYVVVRGTLDQAIAAIRDNNAMGFSALMFVEAVVMTEGGVGVLMHNAEKHMQVADVYAAALAVLAVGLGLDWALRKASALACPWAVRQ